MTPEQTLTYALGIGSFCISAYTLFAKGRETAWSQGESIRKNLQEQIDELKESDEKKSNQIATLNDQIAQLRDEVADHRRTRLTFLEFLQDFLGGNVDLDRLKRRAEELLKRFSGGTE